VSCALVAELGDDSACAALLDTSSLEDVYTAGNRSGLPMRCVAASVPGLIQIPVLGLKVCCRFAAQQWVGVLETLGHCHPWWSG
jgi:hypothetical protein